MMMKFMFELRGQQSIFCFNKLIMDRTNVNDNLFAVN